MKHIPIAASTAYDACFANVLKNNGIEVILVGDSLSVIMAGHETTIPATIEQMAYHTSCVKRGLGINGPLLIGDLPFMTYNTPNNALRNASILMQNGAEMVKAEGGEWLAETVYQMYLNGIPFCGHLGLTPQSVYTQGYQVSFNVKQKDQLIKDAIALEQAGMQILVLKCVEKSIAKEITQRLKIPVLGIGAGPECDGQFIILHDLLGLNCKGSILLDDNYLNTNGSPKKYFRNFLKTSRDGIAGAIRDYVDAVKNKSFPD